MLHRSTNLVLPLIAGCAWLLAAQAVATEPGQRQPSQAGQAQSDYSASERDPFRACVAAHPNDPQRQQNCTWEGEYRPKR